MMEKQNALNLKQQHSIQRVPVGSHVLQNSGWSSSICPLSNEQNCGEIGSGSHGTVVADSAENNKKGDSDGDLTFPISNEYRNGTGHRAGHAKSFLLPVMHLQQHPSVLTHAKSVAVLQPVTQFVKEKGSVKSKNIQHTGRCGRFVENSMLTKSSITANVARESGIPVIAEVAIEQSLQQCNSVDVPVSDKHVDQAITDSSKTIPRIKFVAKPVSEETAVPRQGMKCEYVHVESNRALPNRVIHIMPSTLAQMQSNTNENVGLASSDINEIEIPIECLETELTMKAASLPNMPGTHGGMQPSHGLQASALLHGKDHVSEKPMSLPVVIPTGHKLNKGQYIPVLCKIQNKTSGNPNASNSFDKQATRNSGSVSVQTLSSMKLIADAATCTSTASTINADICTTQNTLLVQDQAVDLECISVSIPGQRSKLNPLPSDIEAAETSTAWKIIDGRLQKYTGSPISNTFVGLPPKSRRCSSNTKSNGVLIQHAVPNSCVQPSSRTNWSSLKDFFSTCDAEMSNQVAPSSEKQSSSRSAMSRIQVQVCIPPDDNDREFVESLVNSKPDVIQQSLGSVDRIAYSYQTEGLVAAPGLILTKHNEEIQTIGSMVDIQSEISGSNIPDLENTSREIDVINVSAVSLKMTRNVSYHMDPMDMESLETSESLQSGSVDALPNSASSHHQSEWIEDPGENGHKHVEHDSQQDIDVEIRGCNSSASHNTTIIPQESDSQEIGKFVGQSPSQNSIDGKPDNEESANDQIDTDISIHVPGCHSSVGKSSSNNRNMVKTEDDVSKNLHDQVGTKCCSDDSDIDLPITHEGLKALIAGADHSDGESIDIEGIEEVSCTDILHGLQLARDSEVETNNTRQTVTAFGCYLCNYCCLTEQKLVDHWMSIHIQQKPYLCCICQNAAFTTSFKLLSHISKYHHKYRECLPIAFKKSDVYGRSLVMFIGYVDSFAKHKVLPDNLSASGLDEMQISVLFCKGCAFKCEDPMSMRKHQQESHTKSYSYGCASCKKAFHCRFDLIRHRRMQHPQQDFDDRSFVLNMSQDVPSCAVKLGGCTVDWNDVCKAMYVDDLNSVLYTCQICCENSTETHSAKDMWSHLTSVHDWPQHVKCDACNTKIMILDMERVRRRTSCPPCSRSISLVPTITEIDFYRQPVYICQICDYKTKDRASMSRHVKYNYAHYKPYQCLHCDYASMERSKVKKHGHAMHSGKQEFVRACMDAVHDIGARTEYLMQKVTVVVLYNELESYLGEDEELHHSRGSNKFGVIENNIRIRGKGLTKEQECHKASATIIAADCLGAFYDNGPLYPCEDCDFLTTSWKTYSRHRRHTHMDYATPQAMLIDENKSPRLPHKPPNYSHFRCSICGYCCVDRSSMSRHIKYMHMHDRPHSCPYCGYKNVEKTKVRLHVSCNHPKEVVYVETNESLLLQMTANVKGHYTKVDHNAEGKPLEASRPALTTKRKGASHKNEFVSKRRRTNKAPSATPIKKLTTNSEVILGDIVIKHESKYDDSVPQELTASKSNVTSCTTTEYCGDDDQADVDWVMETIESESNDDSDES